MGEQAVSARAVVAIPMRTRFRGIELREALLVEGPAGWAEFSPFWDYGAAESLPWWRAAVASATEDWPAPVRERIPVNVTVPAVSPELAAQLVRRSGCRTAKVKVAEPGQAPSEDLARLAAVRDAIGPAGKVRIDVNGNWDLDRAARLLPRMDSAAGGLEYAEQPCASVDELAALRRRVDIPIAADESVRRAEDPLLVARAEAADIVVLKVAPLGGVRACLDLAAACGLPVVVSSALETSIGIAAGVALAAALPELPYACGLATVALLTGDVVVEPLLPVDGELAVSRPRPTPQLLAAHAASAATTARWQERLAAVRSLG